MLAAACAAAVAAGCGSGSTGAGAQGSTLVVARVKDAVILDPSHATDGMSLNISSETMQGLVRFKPGTFDVVPDAAASWTRSDDGRTWTFALKPKLVFADGAPLDAAAVKYNFDRWRLPSHPAHGRYSYAYYQDVFGAKITAVDAPDAAHVVFHLSAPLGPFLRNLAMQSFQLGSPKALAADPAAFERKPVGSGPYQIAEWVRDDHITLSANPSWSGAKPAYGTVIVRDIPDQATSVLSMEHGDVDIMTDPRPDDAKALASRPGVRIALQPSNNTSYLSMQTEKKPWGDARVRRAVAYALDRAGMVRGLYTKGAIVADSWLPPGMLGENKALRAYPHDVAAAKALLAEAGFPHGFTTTLMYPTSPRPYLPEPQRVAEAIQANLREAGIDVQLQPFEFAVFLDNVKHGRHDMCLIGWTGDNGDPDNFFYPLLDPDSAHKDGTAQNYSFWRDPAFHALMLEGQRTVDDTARAAVYRKADAMVHDAAPAIPLVHTTVPVVLKSSLRGFVPSPNTTYNFNLIAPGGA